MLVSKRLSKGFFPKAVKSRDCVVKQFMRLNIMQSRLESGMFKCSINICAMVLCVLVWEFELKTPAHAANF